MTMLIKMIDEKIEALQIDADSYRWTNSLNEKWCKQSIKFLKKIRRELLRELKNQRILKL